MNERIAANKRRARSLAVAFALPPAIVVALVGLIAGLPVVVWVIALFVVVAVVASVVLSVADARVLATIGAVPADEDGQARFHNLVEGLCTSAGLPKPRLYVVESAALNVCALGRDPDHAAIVATTGLLDTLSRVELEGVFAHELVRIRGYDTLPSTVAAVTVGLAAGFAPFASLSDRLLRYAVPLHGEDWADLEGVRLTRYPPGLISALERVQADPNGSSPVPRVTAHLWITEPMPSDGPDGSATPEARFTVHTPLDQRIERLREL